MDSFNLPGSYKILVDNDALYESPKDENGNYLGPLVAYAGVEPTTKKNWVGFAYYNIAKIEQVNYARKYIANLLANKIHYQFGIPDLIIGAPMGGIIMSVTTADLLFCNVAFFEKKVTKAADVNIKEASDLIFTRHDVKKDNRVIIFEDVCNNFSTTKKMINILESRGATVLAIVCVVNRSFPFRDMIENIPVISAVDLSTEEFSQDDLKISEMIAANNIAWKPKAEWERLKQAMQQ